MVAALEMDTNGNASFAFQGDRMDIWHRMGQHLGNRHMTRHEAAAAANMDRPIYTISLGDLLPAGTVLANGVDKHLIILGGKHDTLVTADGVTNIDIPEKVVGVMGEGGADAHSTLPLVDRLEFAEHISTANSDFVWSTAGMLYDGAVGFAAMDGGEFVLDPNGVADRIKRYVVVSWSLNGTRPLEISWRNIRPVCANTLEAGDYCKDVVVKVKHTRNAAERYKAACEALAKGEKAEAIQRAKAEALIRVADPDKKAFYRLVEQVIPLPEKSGRGRTMAENKRTLVEALYGARTNEGTLGRSLWTAYNTIGEYLDWFAPVRGVDQDATPEVQEQQKQALRMGNQFDGTYADVKGTAEAFLLQWAADAGVLV